MMSLSFEPASLDGVVGLFSLIHLPQPNQVELIGRIGKWTKSGGYILINLSAEESEATYQKKWLGGGDMFWSGFDIEKSKGLIEGAGFAIVEAIIKQDVKDSEFLWVLARKK